ncbi:MAG: cupin, partial [Oceanicaulis sp.]|nr:cupin [Oceanicaulis sp.]
AGAPLSLSWSEDATAARHQRLGPNLRAGERPQQVIPAHAWQTAESLGAWTLVSCLVAPGFEFDGFELAPEDWRPGPDGAPG